VNLSIRELKARKDKGQNGDFRTFQRAMIALLASPVKEARTGGSKELFYLWMRLPEEFPIMEELLDALLFGQLFDKGRVKHR